MRGVDERALPAYSMGGSLIAGGHLNGSSAASKTLDGLRRVPARPSVRFVPIRTPAQQSVLMLHRIRELFVRQRTILVGLVMLWLCPNERI